MKLTGTFNYLGIDKFVSPKTGQMFMNACFLQGTEVQKVFIQEKDLSMFSGIDTGVPVNVEFDIRVGQKTYVSVVSINPVASVNSGDANKQKSA